MSERFKKLRGRKKQKPAPPMSTSELITVLHEMTGVEKYKVWWLMRHLGSAVLQHLKTGAPVTITGLGQFRPIKKRYGGQTQVRIAFRGATKLKQALGREHKARKTMDKYGVELDEGKKVIARLNGKCPDCGSELPRAGEGVELHCPNCGTKPFERKTEEEK